MRKGANPSLAVLVVEDVAETRDGIEKLLKADGYRVSVARDERDGIESAQRQPPDLILVSLSGLPREVILTARRIRGCAEVGDEVPVVIFCIEEIGEGDEVAIGQNVHITRPDNFNQLRSLITRLLPKIPIAARGRNNLERQSQLARRTSAALPESSLKVRSTVQQMRKLVARLLGMNVKVAQLPKD